MFTDVQNTRTLAAFLFFNILCVCVFQRGEADPGQDGQPGGPEETSAAKRRPVSHFRHQCVCERAGCNGIGRTQRTLFKRFACPVRSLLPKKFCYSSEKRGNALFSSSDIGRHITSAASMMDRWRLRLVFALDPVESRTDELLLLLVSLSWLWFSSPGRKLFSGAVDSEAPAVSQYVGSSCQAARLQD